MKLASDTDWLERKALQHALAGTIDGAFGPYVPVEQVVVLLRAAIQTRDRRAIKLCQKLKSLYLGHDSRKDVAERMRIYRDACDECIAAIQGKQP